MKIKLLLSIFLQCFLIIPDITFSQDNDPRWNIDPRTYIGLNSVGNYTDLPQEDSWQSTRNEKRYVINSQENFAVSPNFRVHPRSSGTQSETPITRHPLNPMILYASANTYSGGNFCTGWYVTTDGGVTWSGNDTMFTAFGTAIFNWGDPAPIIDRTGRLLITYLTSSFILGASYSTNNGVNWSSPVTFPGATTSSDKPFSATDDDPASPYYGRSYTAYTEFSGSYTNRIVVTYTTNGGVQWTSIVPVSPLPSSGHFHHGCDLRVGPGGVVYICWANSILSSPFQEDSLGFARSTNGGVNWISTTNHAVNMNGIRTSNLYNGIRANGFPRIDIDRTNGSRAGFIYVVTAEKNFAPAKGVADIVLMRSSNSGASWTRIKVNQNTDSTKYDYCPAVRVDEAGGVNVCYYSTRNTPTNDSAEIYLSYSTDGGSKFSDVLVSDHKFKPKHILGTATGYQGDYIGITSANGKVWPYWADDITGNYQAWIASVNINYVKPTNIYTLGKIPFPWGLSDTLADRPLIENSVALFRSFRAGIRLNKVVPGEQEVTLRVRLRNRVSPFDTRYDSTFQLIISSIDSVINVRLPGFSQPRGDLVIVQALPGEADELEFDNISDSLSYCVDFTADSYNYVDGCLSDTNGTGFNGTTGNLVAGFSNEDASTFPIYAVDHSFFDSSAGNKPYKIVIYADNGSGKPGSLLYISPLLTSPPGISAPNSVTHEINPPLVIPGYSRFYVGYKQTTTSNIKASYQNENPVRKGAFFFSSPEASTTWHDFSDSSKNFRLDISPRTSLSLSLKAYLEGFFNGTTMIADTAIVSVRNFISPYALIDQDTAVLNNIGMGTFDFRKLNRTSGYYFVVRHRNHIETWSHNTQEIFNEFNKSYNFTDSISKAYGNNMKNIAGKFAIYSGDVNQDGIVDATDLALIDNDAANFVVGYVKTDLNGDLFVDATDAAIADNNAAAFVSVIRP